MHENKLISSFISTGALLEGHFLLTSGRHSNKYFEKFNLLSQPNAVSSLCKTISRKFIKKNIDIVIGAATGGIILAFEIAKQLNTKGIFSERLDNKMVFRRGFSITKGQRVLLVDDVVTTGGSIFELIKLVEIYQANIVGISVMFDRTNGEINFNYPYFALHSEKIKSWNLEDCPQCKNDIPFTKRGMTGKNKIT